KDGCTLLCVVTPVLFHVALGFRLDTLDRGLDACFDCLLLQVLLCGLEWVTHDTFFLYWYAFLQGLAVSRLSNMDWCYRFTLRERRRARRCSWNRLESPPGFSFS